MNYAVLTAVLALAAGQALAMDAHHEAGDMDAHGDAVVTVETTEDTSVTTTTTESHTVDSHSDAEHDESHGSH